MPAPIEKVDVDVGFSTAVKPLAGGRRANTGVSGVGGRPVQLASEDAELEDDEFDSNDCFRDLLLLAAVKHWRGVLGACDVRGGGGEFFGGRKAKSLACGDDGLAMGKGCGCGDGRCWNALGWSCCCCC